MSLLLVPCTWRINSATVPGAGGWRGVMPSLNAVASVAESMFAVQSRSGIIPGG